MNRIARHALAVLALALIIVTCVFVVATASASPAHASERVMREGNAYTRLLLSREWRACAQEDDVWCHWDARTHGNGRGVSFVALQFGSRTEVYRSNGTHTTYRD